MGATLSRCRLHWRLLLVHTITIPNTTRAAVLYETSKPLVIEELILPDLKTGQVLVRIAYSGVCGTQLSEVRGKRGKDLYLPHTLGHEASGTVVAVGEGVTRIQPGVSVVLSWIRASGCNAVPPLYKKSDGTRVNAGQVTTFQEYAIVSENRCTEIPPSMPLKQAALLGCAVPTGAGIVFNQLPVHGTTLAVFGVGGVGLSAVLAARLRNLSTIIAVDVCSKKLDLARQCGATHLVNCRETDALSELQKIGAVDFAVDCSGTQTAMEMAFQVTRENGGICVLAGNLAFGETIRIDPFQLIKGKTLIGSVGGATVPDRDFPQLIEHYSNRRLCLDALLGREYSLDNVNEALIDLENGALGRLLLRLS